MNRSDYGTTLQAIKAGFVQRDYEAIFTESESSLEVYSAAYVPGRALCYYEIFTRRELSRLLARRTRIFAVGSGSGSELVSLAAAMTRVPHDHQRIRLDMQDMGQYQRTLAKLETEIRQAWKLSDDQLSCSYRYGDVLEDTAERREHLAKADLITFMFVMNELFVQKAKAMRLVQTMVTSMKKGAHLLVVESAGSFSHLQVGGKTYMVYTLLDAIQGLECLISEDARWYR